MNIDKSFRPKLQLASVLDEKKKECNREKDENISTQFLELLKVYGLKIYYVFAAIIGNDFVQGGIKGWGVMKGLKLVTEIFNDKVHLTVIEVAKRIYNEDGKKNELKYYINVFKNTIYGLVYLFYLFYQIFYLFIFF